MRYRIQKSMFLVLAITLFLSLLLVAGVIYQESLSTMKREVSRETGYLAEALNLLGDSYEEDITKFSKDSRVTLISSQGVVLYDSLENANAMGDHSSRKEFQDAVENGRGDSLRMSDTMGKHTYYYAIRLEDGNVIRIAESIDTLFPIMMRILPYLLLIAGGMLILAWLLGQYETNKIIRPINELDIEHPMENTIYPELTPLLERIENQKKENSAAEQIRREFSANVSHELKTPLTSISGYAEIMKNGMVREADIPVFSERIYKEASRLISLVEDIIKISKLDENVVGLDMEEVDLYTMTKEICHRLAPQAERKKVCVQMSGEPVLVKGIRQILDEMLYNIIENGIKYNKDNGNVDIWVGNTIFGPKVSVADTGIGVPEEEKDRIFERFYRVDKSHSGETKGTGLGLSIVKHGALLHNVKITVNSEVGEGTKVTLQFPQ